MIVAIRIRNIRALTNRGFQGPGSDPSDEIERDPDPQHGAFYARFNQTSADGNNNVNVHNAMIYIDFEV